MRTFAIAAAMALLGACASPSAQSPAAPQGAATATPANAAPAGSPQREKCQNDWDCGTGSCIDQVCWK